MKKMNRETLAIHYQGLRTSLRESIGHSLALDQAAENMDDDTRKAWARVASDIIKTGGLFEQMEWRFRRILSMQHSNE